MSDRQKVKFTIFPFFFKKKKKKLNNTDHLVLQRFEQITSLINHTTRTI
jgi:hypothetical protein